MKWFILAPILLAGCYPGFPDQSAAPEAYDRLITTKVDYATGDTLYLIRYSGVSYEDRGFGSRSRYQIDMHMAKSRAMGASSYIAQIALRYSPSEWPMDDTMSLVIDEHVYHIPLTPVNTRDVARFTGSGMDGDVSVTTYETQIVRTEARIPEEVLQQIRPGSSVLLVFHSGIFPVTFEMTEFEVKYTIALVRV